MNHALTLEDKNELVNKAGFWFHTFDFGDGIITKGVIPPQVQETIISAFPKNLQGKTVLDVGAWDGFYSFECEKRGGIVTAIDDNLHQRGHEPFHTAKKLLNSHVEFMELDLFDLPRTNRKFDVVLFLGVLYHLKNPLLALEALSKITQEFLIVESHYIKTKSKEPMMQLYPGQELCNDPTNWWGPNLQCLLDMLRVVGFQNVRVFKTYQDSRDMGRAILTATK